jgi:hypothetical protein
MHAISTMERREAQLGDAYPFTVSEDFLKAAKNPHQFPYTTFLTMTATAPTRRLLVLSPTEFESAAVLFERITEEAMRKLLGDGSQALRFGHPSELGRPPNFSQAIGWLAQKMGIDIGGSFKSPDRKDGGVDVVAWRPFPDKRSGMTTFLVQCTLQEKFSQKANDIILETWAGWLKFHTPPQKVLAVPGTVPVGEAWDDIASRSLLLDRIRLTGLLGGPGTDATADALSLHNKKYLQGLSISIKNAE